MGASYDCIPLFWNVYAGNIHDSGTFPEMVKQIPEDSIIIFDRGYNSAGNVKLFQGRKYTGAFTLSDHRDLPDLAVDIDSFTETHRVVYGSNHRIIVYHSSK
ncbi:MAG: transposase, partial [Thermoplasmatales archaeon]